MFEEMSILSEPTIILLTSLEKRRQSRELAETTLCNRGFKAPRKMAVFIFSKNQGILGVETNCF